MTKEEINACPMRQWTGAVRVVRSTTELAEAVERLTAHTLLGFDTETRPTFSVGESYPPSLLQLACEEEVFLFQLKPLGLPQPLCELLADPGIIKAGVSLKDDIRALNQLASFQAGGFVDLGQRAKAADIKNHGLRGLAAVLLGFRIAKGAQTSNWANDQLSPQQIRYAATDAWVGRELYLAMSQEAP
ncbi:MAG TPA: 3'-5' exonuclease [Desulfurivibrionaceae bacterium]|nr:3'-5' exonuclease [Desulfurivibrionaceae bacterium]